MLHPCRILQKYTRGQFMPKGSHGVTGKVKCRMTGASQAQTERLEVSGRNGGYYTSVWFDSFLNSTHNESVSAPYRRNMLHIFGFFRRAKDLSEIVSLLFR